MLAISEDSLKELQGAIERVIREHFDQPVTLETFLASARRILDDLQVVEVLPAEEAAPPPAAPLDGLGYGYVHTGDGEPSQIDKRLTLPGPGPESARVYRAADVPPRVLAALRETEALLGGASPLRRRILAALQVIEELPAEEAAPPPATSLVAPMLFTTLRETEAFLLSVIETAGRDKFHLDYATQLLRRVRAGLDDWGKAGGGVDRQQVRW